jgi:phosphatidylglycerophosphatase A
VGVANYLLIVWLLPEEFHFGWILVSLLAWSYGTVALGAWAEEHYKTKDPGIFTTDEVAGFLMAILLFNGPNLISTIFWVFMSNRIIDIIKVPPARQAENLHGGWGILLDDLIAGVYAAIFCHILYRFAPVLFSV